MPDYKKLQALKTVLNQYISSDEYKNNPEFRQQINDRRAIWEKHGVSDILTKEKSYDVNELQTGIIDRTKGFFTKRGEGTHSPGSNSFFDPVDTSKGIPLGGPMAAEPQPAGGDLGLLGSVPGALIGEVAKRPAGAVRSALGFKDALGNNQLHKQKQDQIRLAKQQFDAEKSAEPFYAGKPYKDKQEWKARMPQILQEVYPDGEVPMGPLAHGWQNPEAIQTPGQALEETFPSQGMIKEDDPMFSLTKPSKAGALAGEMFKIGGGAVGDYSTDPVAIAAWDVGMRGIGMAGKAALGTRAGQRYIAPVVEYLKKTNVGRGYLKGLKEAMNKGKVEVTTGQPNPFQAKLGSSGPQENIIDIVPNQPTRQLGTTGQQPRLGFDPSRQATTGEGFVLGKGTVKKPTKIKGKPFRQATKEGPPGPFVRNESIEIPTRQYPNKVPRPQGLELPAPGVDKVQPGSVRFGDGFTMSDTTPKPELKYFKVPEQKKTPTMFAKKGKTQTPLGPKKGSQGKKTGDPTYVKPTNEIVNVGKEQIEIVPAGKEWKFNFRGRTYASKDKVAGLQKVKDIMKAEGKYTPPVEKQTFVAPEGFSPDTPYAGLGKSKGNPIKNAKIDKVKSKQLIQRGDNLQKRLEATGGIAKDEQVAVQYIKGAKEIIAEGGDLSTAESLLQGASDRVVKYENVAKLNKASKNPIKNAKKPNPFTGVKKADMPKPTKARTVDTLTPAEYTKAFNSLKAKGTSTTPENLLKELNIKKMTNKKPTTKPTRPVDQQFDDIANILGKKVNPKKGGLGKKGQARFDTMSRQQLRKELESAKRSGNQVLIDAYTQALHNKGKVNPFKKLRNRSGQIDMTPAKRESLNRLKDDAKRAGVEFGKYLTQLGVGKKDVAEIVKAVAPVGEQRLYTIKYTNKAGVVTESTMHGMDSAVVKAEAEGIAKKAGGELQFFKQGRVKKVPETIAGLGQKPAVKKTTLKPQQPNVSNPKIELTVEEKYAANTYTTPSGQVRRNLTTAERAQNLKDVATGKLRKGTPWEKSLPLQNEPRYKLMNKFLKQQDDMATALAEKYGEKFKPRLNAEEKAAWNKLDRLLDRANISFERAMRGKFVTDKPGIPSTKGNVIHPDTEIAGLGVVKTEGGTYLSKKNIIAKAKYNKVRKAQENLKKLKGIGGLEGTEPIMNPIARPTSPKPIRQRPSKYLGKTVEMVSNGAEGHVLDADRGRFKILVGKRARWYTKDKFISGQGQKKPLSSADRVKLSEKFAPTKGASNIQGEGTSKGIAKPTKTIGQYQKEIDVLKKKFSIEKNQKEKMKLDLQIRQLQSKASADAERTILRNKRGEINFGKKKGKKGTKVVPIAKRSLKNQMKSLRDGTAYIKEELSAGNVNKLKEALAENGFKDTAINAVINEIRTTQVRQLNALRANSPELLTALKVGGKEKLGAALEKTGYDKAVVNAFMKGMKKSANDLGINLETATPAQLKALSKGKVTSGAPALQERVDIMNAALDFAAANPDSQLVKDTMEQVTTKVMNAVIREDVDLKNLPEVLSKYRDDYPGMVKYMIEQFRNKTSEAAQIMNTSSQTSKLLNKMFKEVDPSFLGDIPDIDYPIWKSIMGGARVLERERLTLQTMQLATGARNARAQQFRAIIDMGESLITAAYQKAGEKITGINVEGGVMLPFKTKMMAQGINAEYSTMLALAKAGKGKPLTGALKKFETLLTAMTENFPIETARFSRTPIGSGGKIVTKPFAELGLYGKFKKYHNTVNVTQEMHFRRQAFLAKMLEFSERYGTTIDDIAFWKKNPKFMEQAVDHSLKMTFAEDVKFPLAQAAFKLYKDVPVMSALGHPYIRFFANATKYAVEREPVLTMAEFAMNPKLAKSMADPNLGATAYKKLAMSTSGLIATAAGLAIIGSKYAGSKYYNIKPNPDKEPDKEIDLRGDAPLSNFLFKAAVVKDFTKAVWNQMHPKETPLTLQLGPSDYLQGLLQVNRVSGTGLIATDLARGDADVQVKLVSRYIGQILGGYSTWGRTYVDMLTAFDADSGKLRSTSEPIRMTPTIDKWLQRPENRLWLEVATIPSPFINNIPIVNKMLQPFSRSTEEGEAKTVHPIFKQFTGITTKKTTPLQQELSRLNLTQRPKFGHPTINRRVNEEAVKHIEGNRIMESNRYKEATDEARKEMLNSMFSEAYNKALDKVERTDPHLFNAELLKKLKSKINKKFGKMAPYIFRKKK